MKDTFFFSHDYNSRTDPKIKRLLAKHGILGYGAFWALIEDLYNNANALPSDYDSIAYDLRIDVEVVKSIINDFELFIVSSESISSKSVGERLMKRMEKSIKASESAMARWGNSNNNANALPSESDSNASKGKDSKGKDSKGEKELSNSNELDLSRLENQTLPPDNLKKSKSGFMAEPKSETGETPLEEKKEEPPSKVAPKVSPEKYRVETDKHGLVVCQVLRTDCLEYDKKNPGLYDPAMYKDFIYHWSAPNEKGVPLWFTVKSAPKGRFHLPGRLATWKKNNSKFNKSSNGKFNNGGTGQKLAPPPAFSGKYGAGTILKKVEL